MSAARRYRMYVDESGNHQLGTNCDQYLGLLGVIIDQQSYRERFKPELLAIKRRFFTDDPDTPVVLHREELVRRIGPFASLENRETRDAFNRAIVDFYKSQEYTLISVVIDKRALVDAHGSSAWHPYHYCAEALLERYVYFLHDLNATGDTIAESRGKDQDRLLEAEWRRLCKDGTAFAKRSTFAACLDGCELRFRSKSHNVYGLQMADMLAKVSVRDVLIDYGERFKFDSSFDKCVAEAIRPKYRSRTSDGETRGRGKKLLKAQKKPVPLGSDCNPLLKDRATTPEGAVHSRSIGQ